MIRQKKKGVLATKILRFPKDMATRTLLQKVWTGDLP